VLLLLTIAVPLSRTVDDAGCGGLFSFSLLPPNETDASTSYTSSAAGNVMLRPAVKKAVGTTVTQKSKPTRAGVHWLTACGFVERPSTSIGAIPPSTAPLTIGYP